jgi:hypothetical protein
VMPGIPRSLIVRRSIARIIFAVTTGNNEALLISLI